LSNMATVRFNSSREGVRCTSCNTSLPESRFSTRQRRIRKNPKCSVCVAADEPNLAVAWSELKKAVGKLSEKEKSSRHIKIARERLRDRLVTWLDYGSRIYLRQHILSKCIDVYNFKEDPRNYVLLCLGCRKTDKHITGESEIEEDGCCHCKVADTFALIDACMASSSYHYFSPGICKIICSYIDLQTISTIVYLPIDKIIEDFHKWKKLGTKKLNPTTEKHVIKRYCNPVQRTEPRRYFDPYGNVATKRNSRTKRKKDTRVKRKNRNSSKNDLENW